MPSEYMTAPLTPPKVAGVASGMAPGVSAAGKVTGSLPPAATHADGVVSVID